MPSLAGQFRVSVPGPVRGGMALSAWGRQTLTKTTKIKTQRQLRRCLREVCGLMGAGNGVSEQEGTLRTEGRVGTKWEEMREGEVSLVRCLGLTNAGKWNSLLMNLLRMELEQWPSLPQGSVRLARARAPQREADRGAPAQDFKNENHKTAPDLGGGPFSVPRHCSFSNKALRTLPPTSSGQFGWHPN